MLMTEHWLKALIEGKIVGTVMMDFRKAFDLVDYSLLLKKLAIYKCGNKIRLMESYLDNRTQVVSVNNKTPKTGNITCEVPQGYILGPLLFPIFINEFYQTMFPPHISMLVIIRYTVLKQSCTYKNRIYKTLLSPFMSGVSKTGLNIEKNENYDYNNPAEKTTY